MNKDVICEECGVVLTRYITCNCGLGHQYPVYGVTHKPGCSHFKTPKDCLDSFLEWHKKHMEINKDG